MNDLYRTLQLPTSTSTTIEFEIPKRASALAVAGSDAAAEAFAETVERNLAFPLLTAATVSAFTYGVDEIE